MTNKKFSDFTSTNILQNNEFIATELLGVENRKITFSDFVNQIQSKLLQLSYSDIGCIKSSLIAPADNKQPNMIYCDGSTYYASNPNPLISKFINSVYEYPALRGFLEIPADKSSFKTPDLRNQHLVGAGSGNTAYQYITSKVMNFINNATTTTSLDIKLGGGGAFRMTNNGTDSGAFMHSFVANGDTNSIIYGTSQPGSANAINFQSNAKTDNQFSQINFNFSKIGTSTSTATSTTTLSYNNNIIDTINRVPALAIYHYIDIAVDRFTLDPNAESGIITIEISQVNGLQTALDNKANITSLNDYATISALNTGLNGKADTSHSHAIGDVEGLQLALSGKANAAHTHLIGDLKYDNTTSLEPWLASTYAPLAHTHNISAINNLQTTLDGKANITDLNSYLIKMEAFGIKYTKSGLSTTIASNATALTNLCNIIKVSPTIVSWGRNRYGNDMTPISLIDITNGWKLPIVDGLANYSFDISVRITGALSGGAGTPREFIVYLRRISDNSIVSNGGLIKINDNNFNGRSTPIKTFVKGSNDPFITTGFYLDMLNNSGSTLTLNQLEIYFDRD